MKRSIHCALRRRLKPLSRNTSKLTGEQLSKTKGNLKDGTPSNHLENAVRRDLEFFSAIALNGDLKLERIEFLTRGVGLKPGWFWFLIAR
jgi:hypothetical protein